MDDPPREAHLGSVLRCGLATASLGAGLIHATAVSGHTAHEVLLTFFVLLAAVQIGWAAAVLRRPTVGLLKFGAALSVGVVGIWILSRTAGLAGVPGAEDAEAVGLKDVLASALELVVAAGVAAALTGVGAGLRAASGRMVSGLAVASLGVATVTGMAASGGHSHGHHPAGVGPWEAMLASDGHGHDGAGGGSPVGGDGAGHHGVPAAAGEGHAGGSGHGAAGGGPHEVAAGETAGHRHAGPGGAPGGHEAAHAARSAAGQAGHGPGGTHGRSGAHGQAAGGGGGHGSASGHVAPGAAGGGAGHDPGSGHDAGAGHGAGSGAGPAPHDAHPDGQAGGDPHGGHGSVNTCDGPVPGQRLSRDAQEYATYYLGVWCLEPER